MELLPRGAAIERTVWRTSIIGRPSASIRVDNCVAWNGSKATAWIAKREAKSLRSASIQPKSMTLPGVTVSRPLFIHPGYWLLPVACTVSSGR